jgi:hypothetical protein
MFGTFGPGDRFAILARQSVVACLGAPLLGVAAGRWLRFRGGAVLLVTGVVGWVAAGFAAALNSSIAALLHGATHTTRLRLLRVGALCVAVGLLAAAAACSLDEPAAAAVDATLQFEGSQPGPRQHDRVAPGLQRPRWPVCRSAIFRCRSGGWSCRSLAFSSSPWPRRRTFAALTRPPGEGVGSAVVLLIVGFSISTRSLAGCRSFLSPPTTIGHAHQQCGASRWARPSSSSFEQVGTGSTRDCYIARRPNLGPPV